MKVLALCFETVPPPNESSLLRLGPESHQALCPSCLRHSPILRGDEPSAREHLVGLGWAIATNGILCCPICASRAAPPVPRKEPAPPRASGTVPRASGRAPRCASPRITIARASGTESEPPPLSARSRAITVPVPPL